MAGRQGLFGLIYSVQALSDLKGIWLYNAERHGRDWADEYTAFLEAEVLTLESEPSRGRPVDGQPGLLYLLLLKRPKRDGHIAVYEIDDQRREVHILHLFHTKQDWRAQV